MKKIYLGILSFLLFVILSVPLVAKANAYNEETVFDYADLLTDEEETKLRNYAARYEKYDLSVVFVTTDDALGKSSMTYADEFYDDHQFRPDGVLFLLDMDNREIYICTTGTCIDFLTDAKIAEILDENYTYASYGEYYQCLKEVSSDTCLVVESNVNIFFGAHMRALVAAGLALVIAGIVLLVLFIKHRKSNRQPAATQYMKSNFEIVNQENTYLGCREEVLYGYYRQTETTNIHGGSSGFGGGGSSRHVSSRGITHGGGGRKF